MLLERSAASGPVILDPVASRVLTVDDVRRRADDLAAVPGLTFLVADRSATSALDFLALLEAGRPVALVDPAAGADALTSLVRAYRPERILGVDGTCADAWAVEGYARVDDREWTRPGDAEPLHPDLAVLLTTSGTTGSPKLVRLSRDNVQSNAQQIAAALALDGTARGVSSMPIHYSFGMSVLTSHAVSGGSVLALERSVIEPPFWQAVRDHDVTILGGVPTTYAMLKRLGFERMELPALRHLMQAGGRLDLALADHFHAAMVGRGGHFSIMYGQTEAGPRMTTLPSADFAAKRGSVGPALEGGRLDIRAEDSHEVPPGVTGRVFYSGPNVMMGYATKRADLALGDETGGVLDTGDVGHLDEDGYLFLTGRSKRICKLSGSRVSLDEVEALVTRLLPETEAVAALSPADDALVLALVGLDPARVGDVRRQVANALRVPPKLVALQVREALPLTARGKVDYSVLSEEVSA